MYTLVIVEDEKPIADMYRYKMELSGYKVFVAHDGEEGLALCKKVDPDLVMIDIRMPNMTGDVMLEKMRATDWGARPRVIILTNISRDEAPMQLRLLNVDRYIVKAHHTPSQIAAIVAEVLAGK